MMGKAGVHFSPGTPYVISSMVERWSPKPLTWVRFLHGVPREVTMPFRSKKQRAYMYANHPGIARRWAKKYGNKIRPKKKKKKS